MGPLIEKITEALKAEFPGVDVSLSVRKPSKKVGGFVVWDGFLGLQQFERQQRLRTVLKKILSSDEMSKLTFVITVTPKELEFVDESAAA